MTPTPPQILPLLDVITQMYRLAGQVKAPGRGMSGSEQAEALHIVNSAIDGVKTERFFFYQILRTVFGVIADQANYSVGDQGLGADWYGIERPEKVLKTGILVPGSPSGTSSEIRCYTVLSYEQYANIVCKETQSTLPQVLYYQASLPLGLATLWPVPSVTNSAQMVLYTPQTVQEFTDIGSDFIVPKGFREFLEYDGAVKVHERYPRMKSEVEMQSIYAHAREYKARFKASISTPLFIGSDPGALGHRPEWGQFYFNGRGSIEGW